MSSSSCLIGYARVSKGDQQSNAAQRREIAESVVSGRKSGAEMARLHDISEPTVSRIVAAYRQGWPIDNGSAHHDKRT